MQAGASHAHAPPLPRLFPPALCISGPWAHLTWLPPTHRCLSLPLHKRRRPWRQQLTFLRCCRLRRLIAAATAAAERPARRCLAQALAQAQLGGGGCARQQAQLPGDGGRHLFGQVGAAWSSGRAASKGNERGGASAAV